LRKKKCLNAGMLGFTVPHKLLAAADEVIE
jgi:hypothetical protein